MMIDLRKNTVSKVEGYSAGYELLISLNFDHVLLHLLTLITTIKAF